MPPRSTTAADRAWALAQAAGLSRPLGTVLPDPLLARDHPKQAWLAARALAEVSAFQRALGDWLAAPLPSAKEVRQALAGLRRAGRMPRWWRRAMGWWDAWSLSLWRTTLATHRLAAGDRHSQAQRLLRAVQEMAQHLAHWSDQVAAWEQEDPVTRAPLLAGWWSQVPVQRATLVMLEQRLTLREAQEGRALADAGRAVALIDLVQHTQGLAREQAWEQLGRHMGKATALPHPKPPAGGA